MKIHVPSIPEEGLSFSFGKSDGWFRGMLLARLSDLRPDPERTWAKVDLFRTNQNVSLSGKVHVQIKAACGRCGSAFERGMDIDLVRHLVPHFEGPREELLSEEEEVELDAEDLEFSFYHNDEIDLEDILAEEVLLAQPMNFLCKETCKGLCPRCGANRNEGPCACPEVKEDSPFAVLKGFKPKG